MKNILGLKCITCGKEYKICEIKYTCPSCEGNLDVIYDYKNIKQEIDKNYFKNNSNYSIWRYSSLLPISDLSKIPPLNIGWTPLYHVKKLGEKLGLKNLYIKDDGRNPSASLKDRASAVVLVRAIEDNVKIVSAASTGNAGSSMACLCASVGMPSIIFIPQKAPEAKVAQLLIFGAKVIMVNGTYDDAFDFCLKASKHFSWYNRNTGYNPFTREGKKTCVYEICEQMNFKAPDKIFTSVGDGNIISGLWKGLKDLYNVGLIDKLPKLIAVQSNKSNSIVKSFQKIKTKNIKFTEQPFSSQFKIEIEPVQATTIADSISVDIPRDGVAAVKSIVESEGEAVEVSDEEILDSIKEIAQLCGIFGEPAGVTSFAGLKKFVNLGKIDKDEKIVCVLTGNGLKDISSAMKVAGSPSLIEPDLKELEKIL